MPVNWITVPTHKMGWDSLQSSGRQLHKGGCWGGWRTWDPAPWTSPWALWSSVLYAVGWGSGILISTGPATDRNRTGIWVRSKSIGSSGQLITHQQDTWNSSCCCAPTQSLLDSGNSFWCWCHFWMSSGFRTYFDTVKSETLTDWKIPLRSLSQVWPKYLYLPFWNYNSGNFSGIFALGKGSSPVQKKESEQIPFVDRDPVMQLEDEQSLQFVWGIIQPAWKHFPVTIHWLVLRSFRHVICRSVHVRITQKSKHLSAPLYLWPVFLPSLLQTCKPWVHHEKGSYVLCGVTQSPGMVLMEFQLCESKGTLNLHF